MPDPGGRRAEPTPADASSAAAPLDGPETRRAVHSPGDLKHYAVTVRRFDPARGPASGQDFVLPVDSPDPEHAVASTIANAASWLGKIVDGEPLPVAFMAVRVALR